MEHARDSGKAGAGLVLSVLPASLSVALMAWPLACGGPTEGATGAGGANGGQGGAATTGQGGGSGGSTTPPPPANTYYIGADGNDANPGTLTAPFKTLTKASSVAKPGAMLWIKPGTIQYGGTMILNGIGTAAGPITLQGMSGRPVLDFSLEARATASTNGAAGVELNGYYWHIKGIEIKNAADNGMIITGSNNTIEDVILHDNGDTGLQITVPSAVAGDDTRGANNLILNCDSYQNLDVATGGENADGFAAKLRIGPGNVFRGCRSWNNADDGWDLFAANDVVLIDSCWAFLNGKTVGGAANPQGDGNGFKLGGKPDGTADQGGAVHKVTSSSAFENLACGFVRNNNPSLPTLSGCGVHSNGKGDYCQVTCASSKTISTTAAAAKTMARNADGSLPALN